MNEHPSLEQLQQWLSGGLCEADYQAIEAHLESCFDTCQPLLDNLRSRNLRPPVDMPAGTLSDDSALPPEIEQQVDEICDRFEDAWKKNERPRIEDYLGDLGEPWRLALLQHLVKVDIYYRRREGENPTAEEYRACFPGLGSLDAGTTALNGPISPDCAPARGSTPLGVTPDRRYQFGEEIGRGGMGVVYRASDSTFNRTLAIKVLLNEHSGRPELARRFLAEAQVMSQLQHPGIPPVHDLGKLPDGRPFFAMKLIQGRTLARLLRERPHPAHDLPRFLAIFQQLCQTIAYAHSRAVLHRDLKPSNIMVGAFGEVQVMDWGFAKVMNPGPVGAESQPGEALSTSAVVRTTWSNTLAEKAGLADADGRLAGCGADAELKALTKQCLSPCQAARPHDAGTVANLMTAYQAQVQERLRQVELEKAQAQVKVQEERRRRRLALALMASVLGLVLVGGGGWLWVEHDRQARRDNTIETVNRELGKMEQLREQAIQIKLETVEAAKQALNLWGQARGALAQADAALDAGEPDTATRERVVALRTELDKGKRSAETALAQAQRETQLLSDLDEARLARSRGRSTGLDYAASVAAYERAFREFGLEVLLLPEAEASGRVRALPPRLRTAVLFALDDWTFCTKNSKVRERLRQVAGGADDDDWRRRFRKAKNRETLAALAAEALSLELPTPNLYLLAEALSEQGAAEEATAVLRRAVQLYPADFWVQYKLAWLLGHGNQGSLVAIEEQVGHLRAAVAVRPQSAPAHNDLGLALHAKQDLEGAIAEYHKALALEPNYALAHNNLGLALSAKGDLDGATVKYRKAIALDPKYALPHLNLGNILYAIKDFEGALVEYRKAIKLDPDYAPSHYKLGIALQDEGDFDGTIAEYLKALALDPKHSFDSKNARDYLDLGNTWYRKKELNRAIVEYRKAIALEPKSAAAHSHLGIALQDQGNLKEAIAEYYKVVELEPNSAPAHNNLGKALFARKDLKSAIASYLKAIELDSKYVLAHQNLGHALYAKEDLRGAIAAYRKAVELTPKSAPAHNDLGYALHTKGELEAAILAYRKAIEFNPKYPLAYINLANALYAKKDLQEALAAYRKAIELDPTLDKKDTPVGLEFRLRTTAHPILAEFFTKDGDNLYAKKDLKGAIDAYRKAIAVDPKYGLAHNGLGKVLYEKNDLDGAIAAYRKVIELKPKDALAHNDLGNVLYTKGTLEEAIDAYRKSIALKPTYAVVHCNLGDALYYKNDLKEAITSYRKAITLDPKYARAHNNIGNVLYCKNDLEGAIAAYCKAIELDPKLVVAYSNLGNTLCRKGNLEGAIAEHQKALALDPNYAWAHEGLGRTLKQQGRFAEALTAYRRAANLFPPSYPARTKEAEQAVRDCEQLMELEKRLPALLAGEEQPKDNADRLVLAHVCQLKKLNASATRLYADALAANPELADDPKTGHRYNAACCAALASCGEGEDAGKLENKERARLHKQALAWLRADMVVWTKLVEKGQPHDLATAHQTLQHWQRAPDLAGLRDEKALAKLPEAERQTCRQLWADVAALLNGAAQGK
jgi:tetratricopeptide (TPR) repeat protein